MPARERLLPRVVVAGPTAAGKSDLALDLADRLSRSTSGSSVEIINADASQLYQGMDIGTAKLAPHQRRGYPHHQLDVLTVTQEASVAAYQRHARADLEAVEARGSRAVVVGGSGLYLRALTDALEFPGADPQVRARLQERARREGAQQLWEELDRQDPVSATRISPKDGRRVIRALEVIEVTGQPFSATLPRYEDVSPTVHLALRVAREALGARISARAASMFASGLVEETEALVAEGLRLGRTASRAIGYVQALAVLDGRTSVEDAVADTARATRQLAARQVKWFRRDPRVHWIDVALEPDGDVAPGEWARVLDRAETIVRLAGSRLPGDPGDR